MINDDLLMEEAAVVIEKLINEVERLRAEERNDAETIRKHAARIRELEQEVFDLSEEIQARNERDETT